MVLGMEEGVKCKVCVDRMQLEFKYLERLLEESGTDEAESSKKLESRRRVAGAI